MHAFQMIFQYGICMFSWMFSGYSNSHPQPENMFSSRNSKLIDINVIGKACLSLYVALGWTGELSRVYHVLTRS